MALEAITRMPIKLIRRIRTLRRKDCKFSLCKVHQGFHSHEQKQKGGPILPDPLFQKILIYACPFDLYKWRRVNRATKEYVDNRILEIKGLKVEKKSLAKKNGLSSGGDQVGYSCLEWQVHSSAQIAIRINDSPRGFSCVELIVDEKWKSKDVIVLCQIMNTFRKSINSAIIDAPIAEMVVVGLSELELNRWYAYLCTLKVFSGLILRLDTPENRRRDEEVYWPKLTHLVIRTTQNGSEHLARILNYGVRSNCVIDRQVVDELRVEFTDVEKYNPSLVQNLYQFRCWIGSVGFGDRFRHMFRGGHITEAAC